MSRADLVKETAVIPIGGSEDETSNAVKKMFRRNNSTYKTLCSSDCLELQRMYHEETKQEAELIFG